MKKIRKRWLYVVSLIFTYIIPAILIFEKITTINKKNGYIDKFTSISIVGIIFGLVYIAFLSKSCKQKINEMSLSATKVFLKQVEHIIPFVIVGLVCYLVEIAFKGALMTSLSICASLIVGAILQAIEFSLNKEYFYRLSIEEEAKRMYDIEKRIEELKKERQYL